jgi:hypothetical protein
MEQGKQLVVFNIDRKEFFPSAAVKNQCAGSYFYGKDERLEKAIQSVEGLYSAVLRAVLEPQFTLDEGCATVLRRFWLLQHLRTEAASQRSVQMAADTDTTASISAFSFRFGIKEAVQLAMGAFAESMDAIDDLRVCLIRNRTNVPFLSSDDPAVFTNRWYLHDSRIRGRSFGLHGSGTLAFLPLTPRILCVAYDGDVYSLPHTRGWIDVRSVDDIRALNQHQFLNCFANVFTHDITHAAEIEAAYSAAVPYRLTARHAIHIAVLDREQSTAKYSRYRVVTPEEAAASEENALIHTEVLFPTPPRWPAIVRWRPDGRVYTNGTGLKYVRHRYAQSRPGSPPFRRVSAMP